MRSENETQSSQKGEQEAHLNTNVSPGYVLMLTVHMILFQADYVDSTAASRFMNQHMKQ